MVSENFKSLKDLYVRITPALKSKRRELNQKGYSFLTDRDLWDYLKNTKWCNESDLTLYDIVNDIFYLEEKDLLRYLNQTKEKEEVLFEEDTILPIAKEDTIL